MADLYEDDVVEWSQHQAALLRRMAAGERVNDQVDWENVAEEIESVGNEQIHAVRSLLMRALEHDLKCEAWPLSRDVPHWRTEARRFRIEAADRFTAAMRRQIDVGVLYRRARRLLPETIDGNPPLPVPEECPVTLDELLAGEP
jgi:Domain of unknown function DUF29